MSELTLFTEYFHFFLTRFGVYASPPGAHAYADGGDGGAIIGKRVDRIMRRGATADS